MNSKVDVNSDMNPSLPGMPKFSVGEQNPLNLLDKNAQVKLIKKF